MSDHTDQMLLYLGYYPGPALLIMNGDYIEGVTEPMRHVEPPPECIHRYGTSRYEEPDGTPTPPEVVRAGPGCEWVRRCADCGIRIDQPGGPTQTLEPEVEDPLTGYRSKAR